VYIYLGIAAIFVLGRRRRNRLELGSGTALSLIEKLGSFGDDLCEEDEHALEGRRSV
jgi:hypothetical protein